MTILPDYTSGYSLDSSPFQSSYIPRIPKSIAGITTRYPQSSLNTVYNGFKDSQDFNVGYSLSLDSGKNTNPHTSLINLGYSNVITGSPKTYAAKYTSVERPQQLIESPQTQSYYAAHTSASNNNNNNKKGLWKTISPNVEVFQSKEIQLNGNDYLSSKSNNFDHQKALGRSQGFDYSNVIDNNQQAGIKQSTFDNGNIQTASSLSNYNFASYQPTDLTASQNQQQYDYTQSKSQQQIDAAFRNTPKLPLDTHLLKEAGISASGNGGRGSNGEALPVHIDTSVIEKFKVDTEDYIKTAMRQNTANTQLTPQYQAQFASAYQTQQYQNQPYQFQNPLSQNQQQNQQQNHQNQQLFAPRPQQFGQGSRTNFNEQTMLHFDNNGANNYNVNNDNNNNINPYANVQKQHGFRDGRYGLDNTLSQSFGTTKPTFNYNRNNFRNIRESSYNNNIDLKPPPIVRPRYRTKNKRFY